MKHFLWLHSLVSIRQLQMLKYVVELQRGHQSKDNYLYSFLMKYCGLGVIWSGH